MAKYKIKNGVGIIPEGTKVIVNSAFSDCKGLKSVTIPDSVKEIGQYAFSDCKGLKSVTIPESVTSIRYNAFSGCTGLTSVIIGNSVTEIGSYAFEGCTGLTQIEVSKGNKTYDSRDNCNAIIHTAGNSLIAGCSATTIPDSVTRIGDNAFLKCTGLTEIIIPDSVTKIDPSAFEGCTGLTQIEVSKGNKTYDSRDNCNAIIHTASNSLTAGCSATTIPDSVTEIGRRAFCGCTGLTSITIPDSVTKIGWGAFEGCTGLTSVTIPDSVTEIDYEAFRGCTGLTSVTIPDSVTEIGHDAFSYCTGLTSVTIPDSVTEIGDFAFICCKGLTSVTIGTNVIIIGKYVFDYCDSLKQIILRITDPSQITTERGVELGGHQATVYVPDKKSVSAYKKKAVWKKFTAIEFLDMEDDTISEAEKEKEAENKVFLNRLGIKELIPLSPIPYGYKTEDVLTVTYNINETELPFTAELVVQKPEDKDLYMLVDGQSIKKLNNEVTFLVDGHSIKKLKKEVIFKTPGQHIIRILSYYRSFEEFFVYASTGFPDKFPGSELIRLPDSLTGFKSDDRSPIAGAKKLLLGAGYNDNIPSSLNFDVIDVVPENPYLEMKNDCLIKKETKELMYVSSKATEIPNDVKKISSGSLKKCSFRTIRIPKSVENFTYSFDKNSKIKEIILEEGILTASIYNFNSKPLSLSKVDNPSSLDYLYMYGIEMDSLIVPANVRMVQFIDCKIKRLEIKGDIYDCNYDSQHCFGDFVGEIFLSGSVRPYEEFVPGVHGFKKSIGTMKDGCVIHVKDESVAQTIRDCTDFNPNVKIVIDMNK